MSGQNYSYVVMIKQRLDKFLVLHSQEYSRSRLQSLIQHGHVKVNGNEIRKPGFLVEPGFQVTINIPEIEQVELIPEKMDLDIIYDNNDVIVINKPAGIVVHPAVGHFTGTLVHGLLAQPQNIQAINGEKRPGIVHRLDKDTSGIILIAKNDRSLRWLQEQFKNRQVKKVYNALVDGRPKTRIGRIETSIGRDINNRKRMAVQPLERGRNAITEYFTLENFRNHTYLEIHPLTGRTHQIRVHLAFLNCPVVCDTLYGLKYPSIKLKRHFLHASKLSIVLPGEKEARLFNAPLPKELVQALEELREKEVNIGKY